MEYSLEDFIPTIPDPEDDQFAFQIAQQAQFALNGSLAKESKPTRGGAYKHQEFAGLYYQLYSDGLIVHSAGTGKTCLASKIAETLKTLLLNGDTLNYSPLIQKFYIIGKGSVLTENFKQEIVCICTKDVYFQRAWANEAPEQQTRKVNKALSEYYAFLSYGAFRDSVDKLTDEELKEKFANSGIIVDEAHNLILGSGDFGSKVDKNGVLGKYNAIWKVFHTVPGLKKILLTATPMRNSSYELAKLINLLNPEDMQLESVADKSYEELFPYFRGKVSYLREMTREIKVTAEGVPLREYIGGNYHTIVYGCPMKGFQEKVYRETCYTENKTGVYLRTRQAANFVFPDGSFGNAGFNRYVEKTENFYKFTDEFKSFFSQEALDGDEELFIDELSELSSKEAERLTLIRNNPDDKGIIYREFKTGSGGFLTVLLCELGLGYEIITPAFLKQFATDNSYCSIENVSLKNIKKKKRIAWLTPELSSANRRALLNIFNSPENLGEYIRWCMYTPVGREGLSFKNITMIIRDEAWSYATGKQSERRGIRSNSHQEILELLDGDVNVRIYRMMILLTDTDIQPLPVSTDEETSGMILNSRSYKSRESNNDEDVDDENDDEDVDDENDDKEVDDQIMEEEPLQGLRSDEEYNIDAYIFKKEEDKENEIRPASIMLKKMDYSGFVHRRRNQQDDFADFSADCDYEKCKYKLYIGEDINAENQDYILDYAWYRRNPPTNVISKLLELLKSLFYDIFVVDLIYVYENIDEPKELVDICLYEIIMRKITVPNRFGNKCFISMSETSISLVPQSSSKFIEYEYYTKYLFVIEPENFTDTMEVYTLSRIKDQLDQKFEKTVFAEQFLQETMNMPILLKNYMLEKAYTFPKVNGRIENHLGQMLVEHYLPRTFPFMDQGIIVSTLLSTKKYERSKHTTTSGLLNPEVLRIYSLATNSWRDPTPEERDRYSKTIEATISTRNNRILDNIYGFKILDDDELRLADPSTFENIDRRTHQTGHVCKTLEPWVRVNYFWRLGIDVPEPKVRKTLEEKMAVLDDAKFDYVSSNRDEINYKYAWYIDSKEKKKTSTDHCSEIENKLIEDGRLIVY